MNDKLIQKLIIITGLTKEADCSWCAPGKYQTGAGLVAEASCTWCVAGKYQSGSGLSAAFLLALLRKTLEVMTHVRDDEGMTHGMTHWYQNACV